MAEAVAITGMSADDLQTLLGGPLRHEPGGEISIRSMLGAVILASLHFLSPLDAARLAVVCSAEADPVAGRVLLATWKADGELVAAWRQAAAPITTVIRGTFLLIPADQKLADLGEALAAHRASTARPN